jgi:hypothetical protein
MKALTLFLSICGLFYAQQGPLTDSKIMGLAQAGVSQAELIRMVSAAEEIDFDLRPVATEAMAKAVVSVPVIRAMAARENGESVPLPAERPSPPSARLSPL